jgi:hypothetical protein
MNNSIFRKSSIDRVQSPEQLNDYIRVSNPSAWIIVIATIILLGSVLVWSVFGTLEMEKKVTSVDENGNVVVATVTEEIHPIKFILN